MQIFSYPQVLTSVLGAQKKVSLRRFFSTHDMFWLRNKKINFILHTLKLKQGWHRLEIEKYLNIQGFLEKSLKIKFAVKSTGKAL